MLATLFNLSFWQQFAVQTGRHLFWFACVIAVVAIAEWLWPAGPLCGWRERAHAFAITIALSIVSALLNIATVWVPETFVTYGKSSLLFGTWKPQSFGEVCFATLVFLLCYDFLQYWFHRAQHHFPSLWFAHALHHDDDRMNASTALRNTMWHTVFGFALVQIPLTIICGVNLLTYYGALIFFSTYGFFNHANIRLNLGWFGRVMSGPQWHRTHHGRDPLYYNSNYAALFPAIDMIFGTYREPAKDEFPETGLADRPMRKPGVRSLVKDVAGT